MPHSSTHSGPFPLVPGRHRPLFLPRTGDRGHGRRRRGKRRGRGAGRGLRGVALVRSDCASWPRTRPVPGGEFQTPSSSIWNSRIPWPEMGEAHDSWQDGVRNRLKPWRDRLVHGLGGTMPEPAPRGITYDQLVELLYPTLPARAPSATSTRRPTGTWPGSRPFAECWGRSSIRSRPTAFSVQLAERGRRALHGGRRGAVL